MLATQNGLSAALRALLFAVVKLSCLLSAALAAGPGATLAGILRAGDPPAPVDPPPCHHLRGEEIPRQLRGDRGEPQPPRLFRKAPRLDNFEELVRNN